MPIFKKTHLSWPTLTAAPALLLAGAVLFSTGSNSSQSSADPKDNEDATFFVRVDVPPADPAPPFAWPDVWTKAPAQESTATGSWYDAARLADIDARLSAYGETYRENGRMNCLPLHEALSVLEDPIGNLTLMMATPEQMQLLPLTKAILDTPTGARMIEAIHPHDVLLCADSKNPYAQGYYDVLTNVVALQLRNDCQRVKALDQPPDVSAPFGFLYFSFSEEVAHAYQNLIQYMQHTLDNPNLWAADAKLWLMAAEAQAKIIASIIMVESLQQGYARDYTEMLEMGRAESALMQHVLSSYMEHGSKAVAANVALLTPAFLSLWEDPSFIEDYLSHGAESIRTLESFERIPFHSLRETFGTIPGMSGNMLRGVLPDTLPGFMPEQTQLAQWFTQQAQARTEGKAGPPLPSPPPGETIVDEATCETRKDAVLMGAPPAP